MEHDPTKPELLSSANASLARQVYRNLRVLAVLSFALLCLLAIAPAKSYFRPWRSIQQDYNRLSRERGQPEIAVAIKQIWRPEIELTDRCVSCHLGAAGERPIADGPALFQKHPEVHHDVAKMGCTICHQGQGLATEQEAAHGLVKHWEEPMLPKELLQASCGTCHGESVVVPEATLASRGEYLFELHGCKSCHLVDGEGGMVGPDLSGIGLKGYSRDWHIKHLRQPAVAVEGSRMMSFGHLRDDELEALLAYLETLVGAPKLVRGKALALELGCRGCHKLGGYGGEHGPDLATSAATHAVDRDFSHVEGPHTNENWHRQHLRDPARVSPGSKMPPMVLSSEDEDALLTFVLSQRRLDVPMEFLPKKSIAVRIDEGRDYDPSDGAALYSMYCSACHGDDGEGQVMATLGVTAPAIASADFLAVASDEFLREAIRRGRPGREMPGWSGPGGLTDKEIDTLVGWLRGHQRTPPSFDEVLAQVTPSLADYGQRVFKGECSGCHDESGAGTLLAPSLRNAEFRAVADPKFLYKTIVHGRANTGMPNHRHLATREVAGLIAWILRDEPGETIIVAGKPVTSKAEVDKLLGERLMVDTLANYRATGNAEYGQVLYQGLCQGCHGLEARGGIGPALANPDFLAAASDGFIAGSMLLGRGQRAMKSFEQEGLERLETRSIGDIIAYLRTQSRVERKTLGYARLQGSPREGKKLFTDLCSGCHGAEGVGGFAPSVTNTAFLNAATDGYLLATIARGRRGTAMRAWAPGGFGFAELATTDIIDLVAYIRSSQSGENQ